MIKQQYQKTRKGRFQKVVSQIYLRKDIPCGLSKCNFCDEVTNPLLAEQDQDSKICILDIGIVLNNFDIIENCPVLKNVIIMQTIVEELKKQKIHEYDNLKNLVDVETYRKIYIFANEFFQDTYTQLQLNEKVEQRNQRAVINAALWYQNHLKRTTDVPVFFITNEFSNFKKAQEQGLNAITIYDFITKYCQEYPNLIDYLGFSGGNMQDENEKVDQMEIESLNDKNLIYQPYESDLVDKIKKGELFQGKLSIDRNNNQEGRAFIGKYDLEIKIIGFKNMNRAMNGDIVAIQILPENEWDNRKFLSLDEEDEEKDVDDKIPKEIQTQDSQETQLFIKQIFEKIKQKSLTPCGIVKGILKKSNKKFCGHVEEIKKSIVDEQEDQNQNLAQILEFFPVDQRYPNFYLKSNNPKSLLGKKILVGYDCWEVYSDKPYGHFMKIIGDIDDIFTENQVILMEHNVEIREFSQQVLNCLPREQENYKIPDEELKIRQDLRHIDIVSVDPPGCKDIDDALHCIKLPNNNFQVGVHIADVSYFVKADSPIDHEAAHRCTTVYLVNRRTDMLPKLLTENLCSLKDNVDRLTFSVLWEMTPDAQVVNVQYTKAIIRSRKAMTYQQAQDMIDNKNDSSPIANSLRYLLSLSKILKQKRFDKGALSLASTQVKFSFSDETHNPTDVSYYTMLETNSMVEEFMLLANIAVAEKIVTHFPSCSVLRRHTQPKPKMIKEFSKLLAALGYNYDYSTSKKLADSLDEINKPNDPFFNKLVRILTTRCMNEANYFCTVEADYPEFYHYGLAASIYTHFTSPIRRYADVLVHRLLAAAIDVQSLPNYMGNKFKVNKICDKMNMRNRMARYASRASSDYNQYLFFKGRNEQEIAVITNITNINCTVIIPKYGFEGQIIFDEQDKNKNQEIRQELKDQEFITELSIKGQRLKIFDQIKVKIQVELKSFNKKIHIEYVSKI